jgi:Rv2525c-like, glycoside hydrolase-like domain
MTTYGLDYSWGRPDLDQVVAQGYKFVIRYLSYDNTGKNLTYGEAQDILNHGLGLVSNWEYGAKDVLLGYDRGYSDALEGARMHSDCGGSPDDPIYFSVDWDAKESEQATINDYMRGAADAIGKERVGMYAGYYPLCRAFDAGVISWGWQTYAWSGGNWDDRAHLRQVQNGVVVGGADCDINETDAASFGQWFDEGSFAMSAEQVWSFVPADTSDFPNPYGYNAMQIVQGTNTAAWKAVSIGEDILARLDSGPADLLTFARDLGIRVEELTNELKKLNAKLGAPA